MAKVAKTICIVTVGGNFPSFYLDSRRENVNFNKTDLLTCFKTFQLDQNNKLTLMNLKLQAKDYYICVIKVIKFKAHGCRPRRSDIAVQLSTVPNKEQVVLDFCR